MKYSFDVDSIGIGLDILAITNPGRIVKACIKNAVDLIEEAEILYKNEKYARANLLALLAIEEIGKAELIDDHYQGKFNPSLKKDLFSHTVKFGSKDKITTFRKQRVQFIYKGNKYAWKDNNLRQDSMYVNVRNSILKRPSMIRQVTAKKNIKRSKEAIYRFYLNFLLTLWPKYKLKLPKPPYFIKINFDIDKDLRKRFDK